MTTKFKIGDKVRVFTGFDEGGKLRFDRSAPPMTVTDIKAVKLTRSVKYQLDNGPYWSGHFLERVTDSDTD